MDGLFLEVGPFKFINHQIDKIHINPHSWHNIANLLFIDQPVGTGLSYTMSRNGYPTSDDAVNTHFIIFLEEFFKLHSRFTFVDETNKRFTRKLIFAGESHAGHFIPSIIAAILKHNAISTKDSLFIQVDGAAIGNPWIDPFHQYAAAEIAHGLGLITLGQKYHLNEMEKVCQENIKKGKFNTRVCFNLLDDIIESSSIGGTNRVLMYDSRKYTVSSSFPPGHETIELYLNQPRVRQAIHAEHCPHKYVECADNPYNALAHQDGKGVTKELSDILNAGIRILVYAGQYDLICNHVGTEKALMLLKWNGAEDWIRAQPGIWIMNKNPVGYSKNFKNLNYIRGMSLHSYSPPLTICECPCCSVA